MKSESADTASEKDNSALAQPAPEPVLKLELKKRKSGRGFGSLLCVLSSVAFIGLIGAGGLWALLKTRPLSLNLVTSVIENLAENAGAEMRIENPRLVLAGQSGNELRLLADRITIKDQTGVNAVIAEPVIAISKRYALIGKARPNLLLAEAIKIEVRRPEGPDRFFADLFADRPDSEPVSLTALYDEIVENGYLSGLKRVNINKIDLKIFEKTPQNPFVHWADGYFHAERQERKADLTLTGKLAHPYVKQPHEFGMKFHYDRENASRKGASVGTFLSGVRLNRRKISDVDYQGALTLKGGAVLTDDLTPEYAFANLDGTPGALRISSDLPLLQVKDVTLSGDYRQAAENLDLRLNFTSDKIGAVNLRGGLKDLLSENKEKPFTLTGDIQNFDYAEIFAAPVDFQEIELKGAVQTGKTTRLNLPRWAFQANGSLFAGDLRLQTGDFIQAQTKIALPALDREKLLALWPVALPGSARYWAEHNIKTIQTEPAEFIFHYHDQKTDPIEKLTAKIPYRDGKFTFIETMSPIAEATGELELNGAQFFARVKEGKIEQKILVKEATFVIPDINAEIPQGETDLMLSGDVRTLFTVLDQPPLGVITKNGIKLDSVNGDFTGFLKIALPLVSDVRFEDVTIDAGVQTAKAGLNILEDEYKIRNADMKIGVTHEGITAVGGADVNDVPLKQATWEQKFKETANPSMTIRASDVISSVDLAKLGYDFTQYFQGSAETDFYLAMKDGKISDLNVFADLKKADIFFPLSDWHAPAGSEKNLTFRGKQEGEDFTINDLTMKGALTDVKIAQMKFRKSELTGISGAKISLDKFIKNMKADVTRTAKGGYHAEVRGEYIRLKPFTEDKTPPSDKLEPFPDFSGDIRFEEALMGEATHLKKFIIRFGRYFEDPYRVYGVGRFKNSDYFKYTIVKKAPYQQDFAFSARNGGAFLNAFGAYQNLHYGWMNINGKSESDPKALHPAKISGNITVKKAVLVRAPVLARLLSLASFTGIGDLITRNGMTLSRTEFDFIKNGDDVEVIDGRMKGSAVGLTYQGRYNMATGDIHLAGAVTPFYDLNNLLGNVPLIGDVFISQEGEGLISASYEVSGNAQDPELQVNPLSAFAPGMLRQLLDYFYF